LGVLIELNIIGKNICKNNFLYQYYIKNKKIKLIKKKNWGGFRTTPKLDGVNGGGSGVARPSSTAILRVAESLLN
jgi:hypothetical protein